MENNNNDFTDFGSPEYDYGSTDVDLSDETSPMIVGSQGKSIENVEQNVHNDGSHGADSFDESGDNESDDGGCSGDYSAGDESEGHESEGHGSEGNKNLDENDDAVVGEEMVKINSLTSEGIREIEFVSVDEDYDFYFKYAKLRVHYGPKKGRYVVSIFEEGHNHELTPSSVVHLHPVSRKISEADKAQIDGLQSHGIRTCHVMGYMVAQKGGYLGVGFTKKDLYNYFDKKMCVVIKDGDIYAALNYLNVKSSTDPHSFGVYFSTDDGRLKCPFWADGTSRSDYFCFGDVVAFNTMYKKNKYKYLLVILSGCNHHSCNT
ncbi:hypothetical protein MTR_7g446480 [Medicago truncatula]|uniref:Uncharacterized protein n=1 Tax=Medicago truncatula TaxID=3880 RepID=A0A072TY50_MEDTR|nr:hypothetical protein MTR_7g446480 [Medicago truncatula]